MRAINRRSPYAVFLVVLILSSSAAGKEIIIYPGQHLTLDRDLTLVIEDADSQLGVVWLNLSLKNQSLNTSLLHLGEHLFWRDFDVSILGIYAGGNGNLVVLQINDTYQLMPVSAKVGPISPGSSSPLAQ
jgi:hypothetical protein